MKKANLALASVGQALMPALPKSIQTRSEHIRFPTEFTEMVKAIEKCMTIDEAKFQRDKTEALAVYAKMYGSDLDVKATARWRLHAYARMGELAKEIAATGSIKRLKEHGLNHYQASASSMLAKLKRQKPQWDAMLEKAPAPGSVLVLMKNRSASKAYHLLTQQGMSPFTGAMAFIRKHSAKQLAADLTIDEADIIRSKVAEFASWIDELEQHLPIGPAGHVPTSRARLSHPASGKHPYRDKKAEKGRPRGGVRLKGHHRVNGEWVPNGAGNARRA